VVDRQQPTNPAEAVPLYVPQSGWSSPADDDIHRLLPRAGDRYPPCGDFTPAWSGRAGRVPDRWRITTDLPGQRWSSQTGSWPCFPWSAGSGALAVSFSKLTAQRDAPVAVDTVCRLF